jgi:hypothetical protein
MIDRTHRLPITRQAAALGISGGSVYYVPRPVADADLVLMRQLDALHLESPYAGARLLRRPIQLADPVSLYRQAEPLLGSFGRWTLEVQLSIERDSVERHRDAIGCPGHRRLALGLAAVEVADGSAPARTDGQVLGDEP